MLRQLLHPNFFTIIYLNLIDCDKKIVGLTITKKEKVIIIFLHIGLITVISDFRSYDKFINADIYIEQAYESAIAYSLIRTMHKTKTNGINRNI